jgi:hypothetical protein
MQQVVDGTKRCRKGLATKGQGYRSAELRKFYETAREEWLREPERRPSRGPMAALRPSCNAAAPNSRSWRDSLADDGR